MTLLVAVFAAMALVVGACGGDDSSADAPAEEVPLTEKFPFAAEMGAKVFADTDAEVPEDVQVCVGGEMLSTFGTERAEALIEIDYKDQPDAEFVLIARIFDECVPGPTLAASMISSFTDQFSDTEPGTRAVECVGKQIDGRVGVIMEEIVLTQQTNVPSTTADVDPRHLHPTRGTQRTSAEHLHQTGRQPASSGLRGEEAL